LIGVLGLAVAIAAEPAKPMDSQPTVMIVEFEPKYVGMPVSCGDPDEEGNPTICLAELYEGPVRVLRHLSGPAIPSGQILRYSHHGQFINPRIRLIVAARPFEDKGTKGYFAFWWDRPTEPGSYCVTDEELERWPNGPVRKVFLAGQFRHFRPPDYDEAADFRCLSD
jgi:hypothetical protein